MPYCLGDLRVQRVERLTFSSSTGICFPPSSLSILLWRPSTGPSERKGFAGLRVPWMGVAMFVSCSGNFFLVESFAAAAAWVWWRAISMCTAASLLNGFLHIGKGASFPWSEQPNVNLNLFPPQYFCFLACSWVIHPCRSIGILYINKWLKLRFRK